MLTIDTNEPGISGGSAEIRTRDQRIKSPLLYQLSYRPRLKKMKLKDIPDARALQDKMVSEARFERAASWSLTKRSARLSYTEMADR